MQYAATVKVTPHHAEFMLSIRILVKGYDFGYDGLLVESTSTYEILEIAKDIITGILKPLAISSMPVYVPPPSLLRNLGIPNDN